MGGALPVTAPLQPRTSKPQQPAPTPHPTASGRPSRGGSPERGAGSHGSLCADGRPAYAAREQSARFHPAKPLPNPATSFGLPSKKAPSLEGSQNRSAATRSSVCSTASAPSFAPCLGRTTPGCCRLLAAQSWPRRPPDGAEQRGGSSELPPGTQLPEGQRGRCPRPLLWGKLSHAAFWQPLCHRGRREEKK